MSNLGRQFKDFHMEYEKFPEAHLISASSSEWSNVGSLEWNSKTGEINGIDVDEAHQRQGLATAMYRFAQDISEKRKSVVKPVHSQALTDEGYAWAKSLGEKGRLKKPPKTKSLQEALADLEARNKK